MSKESESDVIAELDDESVATISDFVDGVLAGAKRDEVAAKIAADPAWQQTHDDMVAARAQARDLLSGMQKRRAPGGFATDVTSTIHSRSAGRFFGRRTLGDKMPFGIFVVIAVLGLAVISYLMWASETGSLKRSPDRREQPHQTDKLVP